MTVERIFRYQQKKMGETGVELFAIELWSFARCSAFNKTEVMMWKCSMMVDLEST